MRTPLAANVSVSLPSLAALAQLSSPALELGGQTPHAVEVPEDEALDASWAEPEAFAGCTSKGQQRPDQPQTIQIVRRGTPPAGTQPSRGAAA